MDVKNCPFCKGRMRIIDSGISSLNSRDYTPITYGTACETCHATTPAIYPTKEEAVIASNTRTTPNKAEIEGLVDEIIKAKDNILYAEVAHGTESLEAAIARNLLNEAKAALLKALGVE